MSVSVLPFKVLDFDLEFTSFRFFLRIWGLRLGVKGFGCSSL